MQSAARSMKSKKRDTCEPRVSICWRKMASAMPIPTPKIAKTKRVNMTMFLLPRARARQRCAYVSKAERPAQHKCGRMPWFSSGDGELLGIVFQEGVDVLNLDEVLKPYVTFWGADPIWDAEPISARVEKSHFKDAVDSMGGALLAENPTTVTVVGYSVDFDPVRRLRFADIRLDTGDAYWPFVRLALARFQPKSVMAPIFRRSCPQTLFRCLRSGRQRSQLARPPFI